MKEMTEPTLGARSWETPSQCSVFLRKPGKLRKLEMDSLQFCSGIHWLAAPALNVGVAWASVLVSSPPVCPPWVISLNPVALIILIS